MKHEWVVDVYVVKANSCLAQLNLGNFIVSAGFILSQVAQWSCDDDGQMILVSSWWSYRFCYGGIWIQLFSIRGRSLPDSDAILQRLLHLLWQVVWDRDDHWIDCTVILCNSARTSKGNRGFRFNLSVLIPCHQARICRRPEAEGLKSLTKGASLTDFWHLPVAPPGVRAAVNKWARKLVGLNISRKFLVGAR